MNQRFNWVEHKANCVCRSSIWFYLYILFPITSSWWSEATARKTTETKHKSVKVDSQETWCGSGLESWLKNQRNAFILHHYERALWNTTIKSPIVTVNVKLIGLTLWEELLSSPGPLIWRVTAGYSCVPLPVLRASTPAFNSALLKATQTIWKRSDPKISVEGMILEFPCQMYV